MRALHYVQLLCSIVKGLPLPFKFTCKSCFLYQYHTRLRAREKKKSDTYNLLVCCLMTSEDHI
ncbi:anaphase-promoting complex subunit 5 isoform X1 [Iris pallida]|uniref:Anaphase-promoting complex subunit 5 isoform X1 n=1 Tax=Iris pallida TaxID=29817 RepID=A0AAX6E162_IRIPA|nr:anaphase-promoting complex subunit 5 isoform X1 [Iris pallida]